MRSSHLDLELGSRCWTSLPDYNACREHLPKWFVEARRTVAASHAAVPDLRLLFILLQLILAWRRYTTSALMEILIHAMTSVQSNCKLQVNQLI